MSTDHMADLGRVTWHSTGPDEGPDVGMELGLGDGVTLYLGELADATLAESGLKPSRFAWWGALITKDGHVPFAHIADRDGALLRRGEILQRSEELAGRGPGSGDDDGFTH